MDSFHAADFFELRDRFEQVLGSDLQEKEDLVLRPGEQLTLDRILDSDIRYVGVAANYRNLESAVWRSTVEINPGASNSLELKFSHLSVSLAPVPRKVRIKLQEQVNSFCTQAVSGRYPFEKNALQEVSTGDFIRFFGPSGYLDQILEAFPEVSRALTYEKTQPKQEMRKSRDLPEETLAALRAAVAIQRAFGFGGESFPQMEFRAKPLSLDPSLTNVDLELGTQRMTYAHGPQVSQVFRWSPESTEARIVIAPVGSGAPMSIEEEGPWAWFRLLDKAEKQTNPTSGRVIAAFTVSNRKAIFEIQYASMLGAATIDELDRFRCSFRF